MLYAGRQPAHRDAITTTLEPLGCRFVWAGSGAEALAAAGRDEFAVLLLDVRLPDMGGEAAAAALRARAGAQAAHAFFLDPPGRPAPGGVEAYRKGGVEFLSAPLDPDALRAKVAPALELWRLRRRLAWRGDQGGPTGPPRRAHEATIENEARLRLALDTAQMYTWHYDFRTDTTRYSPNACAILGAGAGGPTHPGVEFLRRVHPDDLPAVQEATRRALEEGGRFECRHRLRRAGGDYAWLENRGHVVLDAAGAPGGLAGIAMDVTERELVGERLRASEARYREIVETAQEGVWLFDGQGVTTYVNRRMAEMLGYEPEEMLGRHFSAFMDAGARAEVEGRGEWAAGGAPKRLDVRLAHRDGRDVWTMVASGALSGAGGRRAGVVAMVTDVTERRLIEERSRALNEVGRALAASGDPRETAEAVARALVSSEFASSSNVDLLDGGDGRPASAVAHADPVKDRQLHALRERYPPDARRHPSLRAMSSAAPVLIPALIDDSLRALAHDEGHLALLREVAPATLLVVPLVARGRVLGALGVGGPARRRPFTEDDLSWANELGARVAVALDNARLLAEAQRERRRAEEAARAKDEFLAVVSHELRTPLNAMLGWATMLRGGELDEAERARALAIVERNARTQARLIEDLLDVSRVIAGKLALDVNPLDLAAVVEAALENVHPAAEAKGVALEVDLGPGPAPCVGDPQRLQQVVWNLASNAVKFTPSGGRVGVRLRREGPRWALRVEDSGRGIAPEFLPYAFERFRQAESGLARSQGGLGLGLSIVKHLVELHGGEVCAESEGEGKGASFVVCLPAAAGAPGATVATPLRTPRPRPIPPGAQHAVGARLAGLRVVAVDNEPDACELLRAVLERAGVEVWTAAGAEQALAVVGRVRPDVVITDLGMPGADGYSLLRQLRALPAAEGGEAPAIALTAYASPDDRERALCAGFALHLPKPVEPAELLVALAAASGRARA